MSKNAFKNQDDFACFCNSSPAELNMDKGCEVSAVLHHGSYVRFGCLQFVFSILTYNGNEEVEDQPKAAAEEKEEDKIVKKEEENGAKKD